MFYKKSLLSLVLLSAACITYAGDSEPMQIEQECRVTLYHNDTFPMSLERITMTINEGETFADVRNRLQLEADRKHAQLHVVLTLRLPDHVAPTEEIATCISEFAPAIGIQIDVDTLNSSDSDSDEG